MASLSHLKVPEDKSSYNDWDSLKSALKEWSVKEKFTYRTPKKGKDFARYVCEYHKSSPEQLQVCNWRCTAHARNDGTIELHIIDGNHTCSLFGGELKHKTSSQGDWIDQAASIHIPINKTTKPQLLIDTIQKHYHETISYKNAQRSLQRLLKDDIASHRYSFQLLPAHFDALEAADEGVVTDLRINEETGTTQLTEDTRNEAVNGLVASTAGHGLSPLPSDLLSSILKMSAESFATTASFLRAIENLTAENTRLRQELADLRTMPLPQNASGVADDSAKFTRFSDLPNELRVQIWKLVANQPRIIEVRAIPWEEGPRRVRLQNHRFKFMNHTPPAILHVNRESREQGKPYYSRIGFNSWQFENYFNTESDIIYLGFSPDAMDGNLCPWGDFGHQIQRIAIRSDALRSLNEDDFETVIEQLAARRTREILLVDETYTHDPAQKTNYLSPSNLNRNLNLTRLSDLDFLKEKVTGGSLFDEYDTYPKKILSVPDFLEETRHRIDMESKQLGRFYNSKRDKFEPILTMTRLTFAQPKETEIRHEGFEYEGGKRHINFV